MKHFQSFYQGIYHTLLINTNVFHEFKFLHLKIGQGAKIFKIAQHCMKRKIILNHMRRTVP